MRENKIRRPTKKEKQAYEAITGGKKCYGVYHKCCFHLHTPASYDYTLLKDWKDELYQAATPQTILDECIKRRVVLDTITLDDIKAEGTLDCYTDQKELLSYLLLADSLLAASIEVILVADHNTINGVGKLKVAIDWVKSVKHYIIFPLVMLGVEISCGDRNHVVGMFDDTDDNRNRIERWLTDHLLDREEGVYVTSIEALEFINQLGGIGYIAHLNSSDILKGGNFSGGFKKRLFNSPMLRFIGLSDADKQTQVANNLRQFRSSPVNFLLDNDAHNIEEVEHNCFWVKGGKCTYSMVAEALNDYHISVDFALPSFPKQYIKGLYIERSEKGFLVGKGNTDFCVSFSNALNCFIGGRGTGKSSALEILEYALNQRCNDERKLNFICMHGTAWVVYELEGEDYLFEIYMPQKEYDDSNILDNFGGVRRVNGRYMYSYDPNFVSQHAAIRYLHIHKIVNTDKDGWKVQDIISPENVRDRFLDSQYSINELVNTAGGEEITSFIENTIFKNKSITDPSKVITFRKKSGLLKMLNNFETSLQQRTNDINDILRPFNEKMQKELRVVYCQDRNAALPDFEMLIYGGRVSEKALHKRMNIKKSSIVQYASKLCTIAHNMLLQGFDAIFIGTLYIRKAILQQHQESSKRE